MDKSDRDLLIRIDERQAGIKADCEHIKIWIESAPCRTNKEKIKIIERIVWGSVITSLLAAIKAFWKPV